MTFTHVVRLASAGALALAISVTTPQAAPAGDVPPLPAELTVPQGHVLFFKGHAVGTQNYICLQTSAGIGWRFLAPQATVFLSFKREFSHQVATHFLSADPAEGAARPTWQHSLDSSQVWARAVASSNDPAFVEAGAIPWLLLEVAGTQLGPSGGGTLARTTFIHRLNTSGGSAPTSGCSSPADVGALALVPYEADYYFYKPVHRGRHPRSQ
jgi:photosystem II stability/assembly factor-like uncharacterized protein